MIMPMVLTVIVFVLCLGFYEHDTAVFIEKSFYAARGQSMYGTGYLLKQDDLKGNSLAAVNISLNNKEQLTECVSESKANVKMFLLGNVLQVHSNQEYAKCYAPSLIRLVNAGLNIKDAVINRK